MFPGGPPFPGLRFPFDHLAANTQVGPLGPPLNPAAALNLPPIPLLSYVEDGVKDAPRLELEERELWQKFHPLVNEMIITKSGRSVQSQGANNWINATAKRRAALWGESVPAAHGGIPFRAVALTRLGGHRLGTISLLGAVRIRIRMCWQAKILSSIFPQKFKIFGAVHTIKPKNHDCFFPCRRIFPALKVKLSGLDKKANYYVIMASVIAVGHPF